MREKRTVKTCPHCEGTGKITVKTKAERAVEEAERAAKLNERLARIQNYWKDKPVKK